MKDDFMRERRVLRKKWSNEFIHGGNKKINRRICRRRLKVRLQSEGA